MKCVKCGDALGWVCEAHPEMPWPHDKCPGPGMPCDEPGCEFSLLGLEPDSPGLAEKMMAGCAARGDKVICSVFDPE